MHAEAKTQPYWMRTAHPPARPRLSEDSTADVVIVGAGLTGLWTAHYLLGRDPGLDIVVLEAETVGYGASGRNGGWVSNLIPGHAGRLAARYGRASLDSFRDAVRDSVTETVRAAEELSIDADIARPGTVSVALTPAQAARQRRRVAAARPQDGLKLLAPHEVDERMRVAGNLGGVFNPFVARVHPGRLVAGIARSLVERGVRVFEHTPVETIAAGRVTTALDTSVTAPVVVRATEGFAPQQGSREFLAMNSHMIITRPQSDRFWDEVGWSGHELISDAAHDYVYGQRTSDGRIALGGRGVPYVYGNGFDLTAPTPRSTVSTLRASLRRMFPTIDVGELEESWSGVLAVSRDWNARVTWNRSSGLAAAGGYVGHGVAPANLAGRTLADLITGTDSPLTALPWVNHTSRSWEPEPLRWLGVRSVYSAYRAADALETARFDERTSRIAILADRISGRP